MNEEGGGTIMKMKKILFVALSLLLLLAFGCSKDTNNSSVTNPNPATLYPTGYVQGKIVDSCTGQAIVGAVVNIGVAKSKPTDSAGQYMIKNVPATSYVDKTRVDGSLTVNDQELGSADLAIDSGYRGNYSATIDMSKAYAVKDDGTVVAGTNYAKAYYAEVSVKFASLEPSSGIISADNAKVTPVVGLGNGDFDFYPGQLTAKISGTVQLAANHAAAGSYIVALYSTGNTYNGNSASGFYGHLVKSTVANADGTFSFTGIEAGAYFKVVAVDTATGTAQFIGVASQISSGCDGSNTDIGYLYVSNTDSICPFILSATPLDWEDLSATVPDGLNITFTFSEPIKATPYNTGRGLLFTTNFEDFHGLYEDISVNYTGNKDSNIPHTLSWNADMTVLTINIPQASIAPAAVYHVQIEDGRYLTDAAGNELSNGPDRTTGVVPCDFDESDNDIHFTTFGAVMAGAVTDLALRDADLVDFDSNVTLTWTPVYGAKSYNLYCQLCQWPGELTSQCDLPQITGQCHPYFLVGNTDNTVAALDFDGRGSLSTAGFDDILVRHGYRHRSGIDALDGNDTDFVENGLIKLAYNCYLRGVDADGIEGAASAPPLYIQDVVHPTACLSLGSGTIVAPFTYTFTVYFSEPMNKSGIETAANWTLAAANFTPATGITIASVVYYNVPGNWHADFTLSAASDISFTPGTPDTVVTGNGYIGDVGGNGLVPLAIVPVLGGICP
jgi:hypothetical protein